MAKQNTECVAYGYNKRKRNVKDSNYVRSDTVAPPGIFIEGAKWAGFGAEAQEIFL